MARPRERPIVAAERDCHLLLLFRNPVAVVVLFVLLLYGKGDPVSPALLLVLLLGGVESLFVDLLRVTGQVVFHAVR